MSTFTINQYRRMPVVFRILTISLIVLILYLLLSVLHADWLLGYSIIVGAVLVCALLSSNHVRLTWKKQDWRVQVVVLATAAVLACTWFLSFIDRITDVSTFAGAVYAAWVSAVLFFLVLGIIGTIVSLSRPENEPFETRARILLRGQNGPHIDYAVAKLREALEHFAESTETSVNIRDFDPDSKKYKLEIEDTTKVMSYINDISTSYEANISLEEVTLPPAGFPRSRLYYCRVDGIAQTTEEFDSKLIRKIPVIVGSGGVCSVDHGVTVWLKANTEPYSHEVKRYTRSLTLQINNHTGETSTRLRLKVRLTNWPTHQDIMIDPGNTVRYPLKDVAPGVLAYEIYIEG